MGDICREWGAINIGEYRGIWVYIELEDGAISEASLQLIGKAREIADTLETYVGGVLLGHKLGDIVNEPIYYGADRVFIVEDERLGKYNPVLYGDTVYRLVEKYKPEALFIGGTMRGRELAPYIANNLKTGITADLTMIEVKKETRDIILIRPPFGAWMLAHIKTRGRRPIMGSVRPNIFPTPQRDESRRGEVIRVDIDLLDDPGMELLEVEAIGERRELPIEKADIIVSGGRGIGGREGFKLLEDLAAELNGVVAGSRKAVDAGWIPHDRQVGQTGKTVKPRIYFAIGISGAAQHLFGIREAKCVVAINIDPEAPIFENSDYGIVGDYRLIVPALIRILRGLKQSR